MSMSFPITCVLLQNSRTEPEAKRNESISRKRRLVNVLTVHKVVDERNQSKSDQDN